MNFRFFQDEQRPRSHTHSQDSRKQSYHTDEQMGTFKDPYYQNQRERKERPRSQKGSRKHSEGNPYARAQDILNQMIDKATPPQGYSTTLIMMKARPSCKVRN